MANQIKRILLKLSGEALSSQNDFGIEPKKVNYIIQEIRTVHALGVEIAIVIGGGNIYRGEKLTKAGFSRVSSDQIGMMATLMNALVLRDAFEKTGISCVVMSALPVANIFQPYDSHRALQLLGRKTVMIFAGGTGNPFFTTDSAAALRASEIQADVLLKATNVSGVYSEDPLKNPNAKFYPELPYQRALDEKLGVMDLTAFCICRDNHIKIRVYNANKAGALKNIIEGREEGTLVY